MPSSMIATSKAGYLLRRFLTFAGVGVIGTAAHYLTLSGLFELFDVSAVIASSAGYMVGALINYVLNYHYTFRSSQSHTRTAPLFFAIAGAGFFMNGAIVGLLTTQAAWHYLLAQLVATGTVLIWNFLANHFGTFREPASGR
jgi:putative flippase GtrA